jgi:thiol-disulfide isomerase/thioredoxin
MNKLFLAILICVGISVQAQTNLTEAVNFTVTDTQGNTIELFELLDEGNIVMLDFFTTGCGGCQTAAPHVQQTWEHFGCGNSNVEIIAVNYGAYDDDVIEFEETYGLQTPAVSGNDGGGNDVHTSYGVTVYPTFVIIDPDRTILKQQIYTQDFETFSTVLEAAGGIPMACDIGIDQDEFSEVNIYPNPAKSNIYIDIQSKEDLKSIALFDINGKLALDLFNEGSNNLIQADLSELSKGIYFLEINWRKEKQKSIHKIVVY